MTKFDCVLHKTSHTSESGSWTLRTWQTEEGEVFGWGCTDKVSYPEFTPEYIKAERPKYLKSMIQSHRQGELSKEYTQLYPKRTKEMVKAGVITQKEVDRAKPVWRGLPNYHNLHKTE